MRQKLFSVTPYHYIPYIIFDRKKSRKIDGVHSKKKITLIYVYVKFSLKNSITYILKKKKNIYLTKND